MELYLPEQYVQKLVDLLHTVFDTVSLGNLINVVIEGMEMVGEMEHLSGVMKKRIVMDGVTEFVDEKDALGVMEPILLDLIPVVIDQLIAADKQSLNLHPQVKEIARSCLGFCKTSKKKK